MMKVHRSRLSTKRTECGKPWYYDGDFAWVDGIVGEEVRDDFLELDPKVRCEDCDQEISERAWERQMEEYYGG